MVTGQQYVLSTSDNETVHEIDKIHRHRQYDDTYSNDIALIVLRNPITQVQLWDICVKVEDLPRTGGIFSVIIIFSRVHATLHPALSVRWSVRPSVRHTLLFL